MKKYEVICPHCCWSFHETTEAFVEDAPAKGHMFRLKQHYVDCGWSAFPPYDSTEYNNIVCPACDQPYVDSRGIVQRVVEVGEYPDPVIEMGTKLPEIPIQVQDVQQDEPPRKRRGRKAKE